MSSVAKAINEALTFVFEADDRVCLIGEDILDPYGGAFKISKGLSTRWPNRVFSTPISEAAFTGIAAGLALRGERPIVEIMFGDFITIAYDQILNHISKYEKMYNGKINCPVVIRTPMGGGRGYGPTHSQSLEKFFVGIPGLDVVAISKFHDLKNLYKKIILENSSPTLIIENKLMYSATYLGPVSEHSIFNVESLSGLVPSILLRPKSNNKIEVCLICYAGSAEIAINAAKSLIVEHEILSSVLILGSLSPLPLPAIFYMAKDVEQFVVIEEGTAGFGIGAEISASISENYIGTLRYPVLRISAGDGVIPCTSNLEKQFLPSLQGVIDGVLKSWSKYGG